MEQGKSRLQLLFRLTTAGSHLKGEARLATSPGSRLGLLLKVAFKKKNKEN